MIEPLKATKKNKKKNKANKNWQLIIVSFGIEFLVKIFIFIQKINFVAYSDQ